MPDSAAKQLKDRLRIDLKDALKGGRKSEMSLIRSLLAAIDNAEAPPRSNAELRYDPDAASEIDRLDLSPEQLRSLLVAECDARKNAASQLDRHGQADKADSLRNDAATVLRYLG